MKKVIKRGILEHPRNRNKFLTYNCEECEATFKTNEYTEQFNTNDSVFYYISVCPMCGRANKVVST